MQHKGSCIGTESKTQYATADPPSTSSRFPSAKELADFMDLFVDRYAAPAE